MFGQQWLQRTPHCATRAQYQNTFAFEAKARVDRQVAHQACAVGVVAQHVAIGQLAQGIHRTGPLRARGQLRGQAVGLFLEWHRDIGATPIFEKRGGAACEIIQRCEQGVVLHGLTGLLGK